MLIMLYIYFVIVDAVFFVSFASFISHTAIWCVAVFFCSNHFAHFKSIKTYGAKKTNCRVYIRVIMGDRKR